MLDDMKYSFWRFISWIDQFAVLARYAFTIIFDTLAIIHWRMFEFVMFRRPWFSASCQDLATHPSSVNSRNGDVWFRSLGT